MTLRELIGRWIEANKVFVRKEMITRAVSRQTAFKTSELYSATHERCDPVFVLSTGRTGTKLLTKILAAHSDIEAFHEPFPEPYYHAGYAYRHHAERHEELSMMIDCARYELIRDVFLVERKYVETNNRITFFAYQLADLYPRSKFVHLIRNPVAFVRSGNSRGWYSDRVITDEGRIRPAEDQQPDWDDLSRVSKIAWLWNETNRFIHDFKATLPDERILTLKSENLFEDFAVSRTIFDFVGVESLPDRRLRRMLKRPVNRQRRSNIQELTPGEKDEITELTPLAKSYYP